MIIPCTSLWGKKLGIKKGTTNISVVVPLPEVNEKDLRTFGRITSSNS